MSFIAVDMGSSFTKIALLNANGVVAEKQEPTLPALLSGNGRFEIDAEAYFRQVAALLDEFVDMPGAEGILFSTQMHGYVLTDIRCSPITPYVSWQDRLGALHLEEIGQTFSAADVLPSGVPLKGNLALCSLLARMGEGFVIPQGTLFHTLGGYIITRLTGHHTCHITNAAPTGLADVQQHAWNTVLLGKAHLEQLTMPELICALMPVGQYRGIPVYPDIGDQQACAYGAELQPECSLHVNIGTAGLLGAVCQKFDVAGFESRPWLEESHYLRTVSGLLGGRHVAAARATLDCDDEQAWHIMTTNPPAHVLKLYEEMADQYYDKAVAMCLNVTSLRYSGGCVLKNPALRACIEKRFHLPISETAANNDIWKGMQAIAQTIQKNR